MGGSHRIKSVLQPKRPIKSYLASESLARIRAQQRRRITRLLGGRVHSVFISWLLLRALLHCHGSHAGASVQVVSALGSVLEHSLHVPSLFCCRYLSSACVGMGPTV